MPIYKQDGKKNGLQKYRVIVSFTDQNGEYKQISRTAYGKEEAKQLEAALLDECKKTTDSRMTVSELADEYLASKKQNVRATTYDKTRRNLNLYILPVYHIANSIDSTHLIILIIIYCPNLVSIALIVSRFRCCRSGSLQLAILILASQQSVICTKSFPRF